VRREEARVAGLKDQLLVVVRLQHGEVVGVDDAVAGDLVVEGRVRQLEGDGIAGAEAVDVGERRQVRRPVAGDVDELTLARYVGVHLAARPLCQVVVRGAVDDDRLEAEAGDDHPADRLALLQRQPVGGRIGGDARLLRLLGRLSALDVDDRRHGGRVVVGEGVARTSRRACAARTSYRSP
jgi:hypothetical protein